MQPLFGAAAVKKLFTGPGATIRVVGAALLISTIAAQHPIPLFRRFKSADPFSLLPNWRFFAPNPSMHDMHLIYRTLDSGNDTSEWRSIDVLSERKFRQIAWFPTRRLSKSVFDLSSDILQVIHKGFGYIIQIPAYRVLIEYLRAHIRDGTEVDVVGFQFALARSTGYDRSYDPEIIFTSPYTSMQVT